MISVNFLSCLGVAMGVYALLFVLLRIRTILRLSPALRVLALVGALGLIAHTALALACPLGAGGHGSAPIGTVSGNWVMARSGPEDWVIDGKTVHINGAYLMKLPEGVQYTIEYPCQFDASGPPKDAASALRLAFPLMKHAFQQGLYTRLHVTKVGAGEMVPTRIGVVVYQQSGNTTAGNKVALSLDEIKAQIEHPATTSPATMP